MDREEDTEMTRRSARDGLCDEGSEANDVALEELAEVLKNIGFSVRKKSRREYTLRVYPRKGQYPLLNPRFKPTAADVNPQCREECLEIAVWSKGEDASLDALLASFQCAACVFVPGSEERPPYRYHGTFAIPVHFIGEAGKEQIAFAELSRPLVQIYEHLQGHA
jgi:hypothetical protein